MSWLDGELQLDFVRILIVDDDLALGGMLTELLDREGFEAVHAPNARAALDLIARIPFGLVILDIMMPRMDGLQLLRRVRSEGSLPVLMLSARGREDDRILGLELGADDYLAKPFSARELVARIRSILRRSDAGRRAVPSSALRVGSLTIDCDAMSVTLNDVPVRLTAAEFRVLEALMRSPGEIQSKAGLSYRALGRPLEPFDRSIDTHVSNIRRKLFRGERPDVDIRCLRGHGYLLTAASVTS